MGAGAGERANETAGHVVMTDDQKFDLMNGKEDSLLRQLEKSERTQNRRHTETLGKNSCNKSGCKFSERRGKVIQHAEEERVGQSEALDFAPADSVARRPCRSRASADRMHAHAGLLAFHEFIFTQKLKKTLDWIS